MNLLQRIEYVILRLIRRFIVTERIARRLSGFVPYYQPSINERDPASIVRAYQQHLDANGEAISGRRVLEAGSGRTLMVPYALANAGAAEVVALEPFVELDSKLNEDLLAHHTELMAMGAKVRRVENAECLQSNSIDVLLSNSVLEHVIDLDGFFADCHRVLAQAGVMLHIVDYRDHFFKYPYAFLTFSRRTWNRWLNPGDLPRWRIYDHVDRMHEMGFEVTILDKKSDVTAFAQARERLGLDFANAREGVEVTQAVLLARKATANSSVRLAR